MPTAPPYRAAPARRPVVEARETTAPLGVGRPAALALLVAGVLGAMVPQAAEIECIYAGAQCKLVTHRGLYTAERSFDGAHIDAVTAAGDPDLALARSIESLRQASDGRRLPLASSGIYYDDSADVWRNDNLLVEAARRFFLRGGGYFTVRQEYLDGVPRLGAGASLLAPLAGLAWLLWSERRTRRLSLSVDVDSRTARARSVGLGGATIVNALPFGAELRLQCGNDLDDARLPLVGVTGADGTPLPLLRGHALAHRADLARLVARVNRALADASPAGRSPSLALRLAPSLVLALASIALPVQVVVHGMSSIPSSDGEVEVTSSADRCEVDGMTLLRGARVAWSHRVGETTREFTAVVGGRPARTVPVTFEVRPERVTGFDCAEVARAGSNRGLRVTPSGIRRDSRDETR